MRALMVQSEFELEAYDNPDQNFDVLYDRICSTYLDVDCHRSSIWGYDPFYAAIPIYQQNYVLADMFAYQVHHTLDQIMQAGTGKGLTTEYLIAALKG